MNECDGMGGIEIVQTPQTDLNTGHQLGCQKDVERDVKQPFNFCKKQESEIGKVLL